MVGVHCSAFSDQAISPSSSSCVRVAASSSGSSSLITSRKTSVDGMSDAPSARRSGEAERARGNVLTRSWVQVRPALTGCLISGFSFTRPFGHSTVLFGYILGVAVWRIRRMLRGHERRDPGQASRGPPADHRGLGRARVGRRMGADPDGVGDRLGRPHDDRPHGHRRGLWGRVCADVVAHARDRCAVRRAVVLSVLAGRLLHVAGHRRGPARDDVDLAALGLAASLEPSRRRRASCAAS